MVGSIKLVSKSTYVLGIFVTGESKIKKALASGRRNHIIQFWSQIEVELWENDYLLTD